MTLICQGEKCSAYIGNLGIKRKYCAKCRRLRATAHQIAANKKHSIGVVREETKRKLERNEWLRKNGYCSPDDGDDSWCGG